MEFHEIQWNSVEFFHGIPWNFPWNFSWNSIEFYETEVDGISWRIPWRIPWNSMEFHELTEFDGIRF
jgi:hypothetical protein